MKFVLLLIIKEVRKTKRKLKKLEDEMALTNAKLEEIRGNLARAQHIAEKAQGEAQLAREAASKAENEISQMSSKIDSANSRADAAMALAQETKTSLEQILDILDDFKISEAPVVELPNPTTEVPLETPPSEEIALNAPKSKRQSSK